MMVLTTAVKTTQNRKRTFHKTKWGNDDVLAALIRMGPVDHVKYGWQLKIEGKIKIVSTVNGSKLGAPTTGCFVK